MWGKNGMRDTIAGVPFEAKARSHPYAPVLWATQIAKFGYIAPAI